MSLTLYLYSFITRRIVHKTIFANMFVYLAKARIISGEEPIKKRLGHN